MVDLEENIDIIVYIPKKNESVNVLLKPYETVENLKEKLGKQLGYNFNSDYDLFLENFHLSAAFDIFQVKTLFQTMNTEKLHIEKKENKTRSFSDAKEGLSPVLKLNNLQNQLLSKLEIKFDYLNKVELELVNENNKLLKIYNDQVNTEKTLKSYYRDLSINLSMISNSGSKDEDGNGENAEDTGDKLRNLKVNIEESTKNLKEKEKVFENKTEQLLLYKLKEKKALAIIKKNEILSNQIASLQNTQEKYKEKKEKIQVKEEKLYNKVKKETKLNESIAKKNSEIQVYFRKHFSY